jgi:single-stranded-DNA-specific exonuclease
MTKKWQITRPLSEETKEMFPEINPVVLQLLFNRDLTTKEDIDKFLKPDWQVDMHDPFVLSGMHKAVDRIYGALEKKEKVLIYGDYDADGICGTAILYNTLKRIGFDQVEHYIPHRESEGYGLNINAIENFKKEGINLIITVDLGVANIKEIKKAREFGIDVVVVDHHDLKHDDKGRVLLPEANSIIHTRIPGDEYPYKHLSGTGTAFKLAQALLAQSMEESEAFEKWLLDLASIGTVADVVPLTGENRAIVKYGLTVLSKTQRLGLKELIQTAGIQGKFSVWNIAFQVAPRVNAAGRISHAREALELMLTEDKIKAHELAGHLNSINQERQKITEQIFKEAQEIIGEVTDEKYLLAAYKKDWPLGVVGLVAGRLTNMYHRPAVLLGETEGSIKGSGRSIPEFHMVEALDKVKDLLDAFGGHEGAAGFTVKEGEKNFKAFLKALEEFAEEKLKDQDLRPSLNIDLEIDFAEINTVLVEQVERFEPFGEANPQPLFLSRKLRVKQIDTVGGQKQHLKLEVCDEQEKNICKVIGFNMSNGWQDNLQKGDKIDIVYELGFNEWNGNRELQIKLKDLQKSFG